MATSREAHAAIIAWRQKGQSEFIADSKTAPRSAVSREIIKNLKENNAPGCQESQPEPGASPEAVSGVGRDHHQGKACSGVAAGRCERHHLRSATSASSQQGVRQTSRDWRQLVLHRTSPLFCGRHTSRVSSDCILPPLFASVCRLSETFCPEQKPGIEPEVLKPVRSSERGQNRKVME